MSNEHPTMPTAEELLHAFKTGHLGTAHGIACVLCHIANNSGDPRHWEMIPRQALIDLAKELTADLPQPYGRTPEQRHD